MIVTISLTLGDVLSVSGTAAAFVIMDGSSMTV